MERYRRQGIYQDGNVQSEISKKKRISTSLGMQVDSLLQEEQESHSI